MYPETTKTAKPWKIKFSVNFGTEREVDGELGNIHSMTCTCSMACAYCKTPCKHILALMVHKVDTYRGRATYPKKRSLPAASDSSGEPEVVVDKKRKLENDAPKPSTVKRARALPDEVVGALNLIKPL